jgi:uncharacterized membrane protein YeaQ/YmgE (transglycosylase-associated protein family)
MPACAETDAPNRLARGRLPAEPPVRSTTYHEKGLHMLGAIILGIVAGFAGGLLMGSRDKMGLLATTLLGLAGAVVGWLIFTDLIGIGDTDIFDWGGLIGAIIGVVVLLAAARLLRGERQRRIADHLPHA